jgi:cysteinyl-tRNA synthetase
MTIRLYNTLTRQKDDLVPGDPDRVTMYVCGPTVYSRAHIGNARPAVVFDVLRRLLRHEYGPDHVVYARNITDIDDRIIAESAATGVPIDAITRRTEDWYLSDMGALGVAPPDIAPHATTSIPAMVAMTADLIAKGHAYAAQGHVLFDVGSFAGYGALSRRPLDEMIAGARVEVAPYKKSPADFVLWKPSTADQPGWDSPWGRGRPGWHIECSAMIAESLGTTIDIHGGGQDLQFPHHENELAQSTCAHDGAPLARIWMHNGFLNMGGSDKMSKSLGNIRTVPELLADGWDGEVLRLALLSAHYRQPLEWTESLLSDCKSRFDRWCDAASDDGTIDGGTVPSSVVDSLSDDLNTPAAMNAMSEIASEIFKASGADKVEKRRNFAAAGRLLGIGRMANQTLPDGISLEWIEERISANAAFRAEKSYVQADAIRDELAHSGVKLVITKDGITTWRRA